MENFLSDLLLVVFKKINYSDLARYREVYQRWKKLIDQNFNSLAIGIDSQNIKVDKYQLTDFLDLISFLDAGKEDIDMNFFLKVKDQKKYSYLRLFIRPGFSAISSKFGRENREIIQFDKNQIAIIKFFRELADPSKYKSNHYPRMAAIVGLSLLLLLDILIISQGIYSKYKSLC